MNDNQDATSNETEDEIDDHRDCSQCNGFDDSDDGVPLADEESNTVRHAHHGHQVIDELVEARLRAEKLADDARVARNKLIENLSKIAEQLKCAASYEAVIAKLVEVRAMASENEALRKTLGEVEGAYRSAARVYDVEREKLAAIRVLNDELQQTIKNMAADATVGAADEGLRAMITLLAKDIKEPGSAKNFVEMTLAWADGIMPQMPFRKAAVVFYREGGKSPSELVKEADARTAAAEADRDLVKRVAVETLTKLVRLPTGMTAMRVKYVGADIALEERLRVERDRQG